VPYVPHCPHVTDQYLEWMNEHNAVARKGIYANLISIKSRKEDDLSQKGKKRAKVPSPQKTSPPGP